MIFDDPKHSFSEKRWAVFGKTDANRPLSNDKSVRMNINRKWLLTSLFIPLTI
jgi:hypothetical protein